MPINQEMNKTDLTRIVSQSQDLPYSHVEAAVNALFSAMTTALSMGEEVTIRGFGAFKEKDLPAMKRQGNDLIKGGVDVPERKSVSFKPSETLRRRMNEE